MTERAIVEELFGAGVSAFARGAFERAVACFADVVRLDPENAAGWSNLGSALLSAGDAEAAAGAHARAIVIDPRCPEPYYNLGAALRRGGDPARAAAAYAEAISLGLDTAAAFNNLGLALADDARLDDAAAAFSRALALSPAEPAILANLGNALGEAADLAGAARCYEAAVAIDPDHVEANYGLFAATYAEDDPAPAERRLHAVLRRSPDHAGATFQLGAIAGLRGGAEAAAPFFARLPAGLAFLTTSFAYVLAHRTPRTRLFTDGFRLLEHAIGAATIDGLVIELGVRRGASISFVASRHAGGVHGFDSFEGLPEAWGGVLPGAYSTRGELPDVPANVTLHAGWFRETLPRFAAEHPGPIRLLHVDCDLYTSTRDALAVLGPRLCRGSVVVFDEYLCNPGWEDEEHRAFTEACDAFGLRYAYIAFSLFTKQAAILVT